MLERLGIGSGSEDGRPRMSDIDLILLDMMMPEMDGIEACRVVQQYEHLKDIPIIMVTAVGDSKKLAEALDAGAVDYVTKPINKVELMARIRLALRLKREKDWHKERDQRIQEELRLAALVQNAVLSLPLQEENFEVHAIYQPSSELAGDLYLMVSPWRWPIWRNPPGHYGTRYIVLSFCMFLASVLKDTVTTYVEPEKVIQELNRRFNQLYIEKKLIQYYFTTIYLVIDTRIKRIDYVNAGHPPALFFEGAAKTPVLLESNCHPVGLFERIDIQPQSLTYEDEGHLVLYTDGLLELVEGEQEEQLKFMIKHLNVEHEWKEETIRAAFFNADVPKERDDDKCIVWISLKKGTE